MKNKMLVGVLGLCIAFALSACKQEAPIEPKPQSVIDTSFLPLAVGNSWDYVIYGFKDTLFTRSIVGTHLHQDSLLFYKLVEQGGYFNQPETLLIRYKHNDLLEILRDGRRQDYISFIDTIVDEAEEVLPGKVHPARRNEAWLVPAGSYVCDLIIFGGMEPVQEAFSRKVGLVDARGFKWSLQLKAFNLVQSNQ